MGEYQVDPPFDEREEISKSRLGVRSLLGDSSGLARADQCVSTDSDNCLLSHESRTGCESHRSGFGTAVNELRWRKN